MIYRLNAARQDRQNDLMEQLVHGKGGSGGGSSSAPKGQSEPQ